MRYVKSTLLLVAVVMSMAYTTRDAEVPEGLTPGNRAPEIQLQQFSSGEKYTLLQFWAAYDATSRANNALISNKLAGMHLENVQLVSVSFDEKQSVFEETVRADRLNPTSQFNIPEGKNSDVFKQYRLNDGFGNLLIDPHGVIVAVDIAPDRLAEVLKTTI